MSYRYEPAHLPTAINGPGDGRPTAQQIVNDNNLQNALTNKVALITGCSSGIGIETARALKSTGAKTYVTVRNQKKGEEALADILEPGKLEILICDQNSLESVENLAKEFLSKEPTLNILINNAGIMANPTRDLTKDGHEAQFGVNHLSHFLLFMRLRETLLKSATPEFPSVVVSLASSGHRSGGVNFDDIRFDKDGSYQAWKSYGQAKTSNIYMANEIERRYGGRNLHAYSLHPGGIWTGLQKHMDVDQFKGKPEVEKWMKSVEQGAATTVYAALDRETKGKGGVYLEDCMPSLKKEDVPKDWNANSGYAPWAYNPEGEKRLWGLSCELLGLPAE